MPVSAEQVFSGKTISRNVTRIVGIPPMIRIATTSAVTISPKNLPAATD